MGHRHTARTLTRFVGTVFSRYTGITFRGRKLDDVFNYVRIDERTATSGQPTAAQFETIKHSDFDVVINLLPSDTENALSNEAEIVRALGLDYIYIPVSFKGPTEEDFALFTSAMDRHSDKNVWVHCAVNARVSVFVARYRRDVLGLSDETALGPIAAVWEPFGVWKAFLMKPYK